MQNITKATLYWSCQLIGWGIYVGLLIYNAITHTTEDDKLPKVIALQVIIGLCVLLTSHAIRIVILRKGWIELGTGALALRILGLTIAGSVLAIAAIHLMMVGLLDWHNTVHPIEWSSIPLYTANLFFMLMFWSVIYVGYKYAESARKNKIEKLETQSSLKEAELIALKAQINPHFLFNSLNNIRALILDQPMIARDMVTNLSDLLRYSIAFSQRAQVTIAEEVDIVKNYLDLESIQYDGRLDYNVDADENTLSCIIPPMIIQTMAENAVKHGISQIKDGGQIRISIQQQDDQLVIAASNTGSLEHSKTGTGIGVKNAQERIRLLFDVSPSFDLTEKDNLVTATLQFPARQ
ncbi:Histidine kinase [Reichenbachiella agariperforans]|uniref:Histidine kinase n=1 Tax=Reichenbachiella agariperforans TaxID=156994 RepID=A0A1M6RB94_REIAG|nr:histidine kinase [Reichenbachiella agariperforans]SHK29702.1 Histidine kinase [Reichenbachiella agariperforans]